MIPFKTDNFNRANADPIGSPWVDAVNRWTIVSNAAVPGSSLGSDTHSDYGVGVAWPNDQYSQAKMTVTDTTGNSAGPGVSVRSQLPTVTMYRVTVGTGVTNNVEVGRWNAGTYTFIAFRTATWVNGDVLRLEVTGQGRPVLRVYQNGVQLGADITDSGNTVFNGSPGLSYSSTSDTASADDWEGGGEPLGVASQYEFPKVVLRNPITQGRVL